MSDAAKLLMELGVNVSSKGGRQLAHCTELAADDPTLTDSIVKVLYPMAADTFGVSDKAIERIMLREMRKATDTPNWRETLKKFESRHGCEGMFSSADRQTLKPFIQKVAYILNSEEGNRE